jgi:Na+-transporting methylmalonyl-CoA/oxaloacetate decarboxylase gamma subunit
VAHLFRREKKTTSDSETLIDALIVSGVGMGVVFVVLAALMIVALLMGGADSSDTVRRFLDRVTGNNTMPSAIEALQAAGPSAIWASQAVGLTGKQVAVIALGIALSRGGPTPMLPQAVGANAPTSSWLSDGRSRAMNRPSRVSR